MFLQQTFTIALFTAIIVEVSGLTIPRRPTSSTDFFLASRSEKRVPRSLFDNTLLPSSCSSEQRTTTALMMGLRGKKIRREKRKALKEPTPPRIDTAYGPIRFNKPPRECDICQGRGAVRCSVCEGRGFTRATGQRKKNPIVQHRLVGSLWTSVEVYYGHRHHTVMEVRGSSKKRNLQVRMRNCCGEQQDFWIDVDELKDKMVWRMGWITMEEIYLANGGPLLDVRECFRCKGGRILLCGECDGKGVIQSYEPLYD